MSCGLASLNCAFSAQDPGASRLVRCVAHAPWRGFLALKPRLEKRSRACKMSSDLSDALLSGNRINESSEMVTCGDQRSSCNAHVKLLSYVQRKSSSLLCHASASSTRQRLVDGIGIDL